MKHKLIMEGWRSFLNEQGIDPVTGQPVTIGGQANAAILSAFGVDCEGDPGVLAQLFVDFMRVIADPGHNALEKVGKGSTYWGYSYYFREAFEACPQARELLPMPGEVDSLPVQPPNREELMADTPEEMMRASVSAIMKLIRPIGL